jgi:hypothetical protein
MPLSLKFTVLGKRYFDLMKRNIDRLRPAAFEAVTEVRDEVLDKGRADIAGAGKFGSRWTEGFKGEITEENEGEFNINFTHDVPYFMIFQRGGTIRGKPFLAIPLSFANVPKGVFARDFPGGLFRVDRKSGGAPLLLSRSDKQPKYFLKESVFEPKKFRVLEIIRETSRKLKSVFIRKLRQNG